MIVSGYAGLNLYRCALQCQFFGERAGLCFAGFDRIGQISQNLIPELRCGRAKYRIYV
jgi:hypothetical protein